MRTLTKITAENERVLNKLLKNKKKEDYILLYHSLWDDWSCKIVARAEEWVKDEGNEQLYLVSSWDAPHAFAAFAITSTPTICIVRKGRISVHVEYPRVYDFFSSQKERELAQSKGSPRKQRRAR